MWPFASIIRSSIRRCYCSRRGEHRAVAVVITVDRLLSMPDSTSTALVYTTSRPKAHQIPLGTGKLVAMTNGKDKSRDWLTELVFGTAGDYVCIGRPGLSAG